MHTSFYSEIDRAFQQNTNLGWFFFLAVVNIPSGKPMPKFAKTPNKLSGNKALFTAVPQHETKNYDLSRSSSLQFFLRFVFQLFSFSRSLNFNGNVENSPEEQRKIVC